MSDEDLKDTGIVRHAAKILSVRDNAILLSDLAQEHESAARFFHDWPSSDLVGLWDVMKKRGARLEGEARGNMRCGFWARTVLS